MLKRKIHAKTCTGNQTWSSKLNKCTKKSLKFAKLMKKVALTRNK
jgi:hypothetical protein